MLQEALKILHAVKHKTGIAYFQNLLGLTLFRLGEAQRAALTYRQSLSLSQQIGYKWGIAQSLIGFAAVARNSGDEQRAVRLAAAAGELLRVIEYELPVAEQRYFEELIEDLRHSVDISTFHEEWDRGAEMTVERAVMEALETKGY